MSIVKISKTEPTTIYVVLHRFSGAIVDAGVFASKPDAESWIEAGYQENGALDYKDSFYIREIVIDES